MAEIDFDGGTSYEGSSAIHRYDRMVHLAGAATSVALLVGAVFWGYELAVRDVTGVPVMRALGGAMRVAPADPGGDIAGHQGLSVNAVAAAGTSVPLPQTLYLAPAAQGLAEEDQAGLSQPVATSSDTSSALNDLPIVGASFAATTSLVATEIPTADQDAVAAALAEALGAPEADAVVTNVALVSSLRPMPRPAARAAPALLSDPIAQSSAQTDAAAPAQTAAEVDPSTIAVGTRLVQLGAFDDGETARTDWARIVGRFPELMANKSLVVQPAESGGRTFYRLRAVGFADEDEARRFCTALLAENATCIPVAQK